MILLSPYMPLHGIPDFGIKESFLRLIANQLHPVLWESGVKAYPGPKSLQQCTNPNPPLPVCAPELAFGLSHYHVLSTGLILLQPSLFATGLTVPTSFHLLPSCQ